MELTPRREAILDLDFAWLLENEQDPYIRQEIMNIAMKLEEKKEELEREFLNRMKVHDIKYGRWG